MSSPHPPDHALHDEKRASQRDHSWDGAFNLSDLGGLPLTGGGVTVSGRVFRSGRPEALTAQGWQTLIADGVRTLVDLRNPDERVRRPWDALIPADELRAISVTHTPTENPYDPVFLDQCGAFLDHPHSYPIILRLYPDRIAAAFRALTYAEGNVLIHCVDGRDRTGMIVAMLLHLTGVEPTAIVADYANAFRQAGRQEAAELAIEPNRHTEPSRTEDQIEEQIAERVPALTSWLNGLNARDYLLAAGLSPGEINALAGRLRSRLGISAPAITGRRPRRTKLWRQHR